MVRAIHEPPLYRPKPIGRLSGASKTVSTRRIREMRRTPRAIIWQRNYHEHSCPERGRIRSHRGIHLRQSCPPFVYISHPAYPASRLEENLRCVILPHLQEQTSFGCSSVMRTVMSDKDEKEIAQMNQINIQQYKTRIGELVLRSFDCKLCLIDFRYRNRNSNPDSFCTRVSGIET